MSYPAVTAALIFRTVWLICVQEIDVFLSNTTPSFLVTGLPMVFITAKMHVIAPQVLSVVTSPGKTQITKVFLGAHVEEIRLEFETVKGLGRAAAEEWVKGLDARGKKLLVDASRWERWFLSGGVQEMRTARPTAQVSVVDTAAVPPKRVAEKPNNGHIPHPPPLSGQGAVDRGVAIVPSVAGGHEFWKSAGRQKAEGAAAALDWQSRHPVTQLPTGEAAGEPEIRRGAEIERRASSVDLSIAPEPRVLPPTADFATQRPQALDEEASQMLKERPARDGNTNNRLPENKAKEIKLTDIPAGSAPREVTDKDWDDAQGPLRASISDLADELIRDKWSDGDRVSKKEASQFAADVLLYVRKRFYAQIAEKAAARRAAGKQPIVEPPEGPGLRNSRSKI